MRVCSSVQECSLIVNNHWKERTIKHISWFRQTVFKIKFLSNSYQIAWVKLYKSGQENVKEILSRTKIQKAFDNQAQQGLTPRLDASLVKATALTKRTEMYDLKNEFIFLVKCWIKTRIKRLKSVEIEQIQANKLISIHFTIRLPKKRSKNWN